MTAPVTVTGWGAAERKALAHNIAFLREALSYNPKTGLLHWKERPPHHFKSLADCKRSNKMCAGRELASKHGQGYRIVTIFQVGLLAHRVAWALHYGEWPFEQIDHINGDRSDNRIANLRAVTNQENCRNRQMGENNKSGCVGVHYDTANGKWRALIGVGYQRVNLGSFDDRQSAIAARKVAEQLYGYSKRHGTAIAAEAGQ